jgi:transposase-like protein
MAFVPGPKVEALTTRQQQALNLLVEGEHTFAEISAEVGVEPSTLWRWRHEKPAFREALQEALAIAELEARQFAVARRVKRVEALDEVHAGLLRIIAERKERYAQEDHPGAATGLLVKSYKAIGSGASAYAEIEWAVDRPLIQALLEVQKQAAIELGQWSEKADVRLAAEVEHRGPVRVIRFEAQAPRADHTEIEADYRVTDLLDDATPPPGMARLLAAIGIPTPPGQLDPEYAPALRRAIAEAGVDPTTVLTPEEIRYVYGDEDTSKSE